MKNRQPPEIEPALSVLYHLSYRHRVTARLHNSQYHSVCAIRNMYNRMFPHAMHIYSIYHTFIYTCSIYMYMCLYILHMYSVIYTHVHVLYVHVYVPGWSESSVVELVNSAGTACTCMSMQVWRKGGERLREIHRSEERRVGEECSSRWSPYH